MSSITVILGVSGFVLFTIGLLIGFFIPKFRNPRMGLSAHLTACQTGPALTMFALFWTYLSVPDAVATWLIWLFIGSSYLLVLGITLAAIYGASEALPIAGGSFSASKLRERLVSFLVKGSSVVMGLVCVVIAYFALTNIGMHL
ncbi:MAG: hydroxylaminobenzene mutase [Pseudomonadota bacterium]